MNFLLNSLDIDTSATREKKCVEPSTQSEMKIRLNIRLYASYSIALNQNRDECESARESEMENGNNASVSFQKQH